MPQSLGNLREGPEGGLHTHVASWLERKGGTGGKVGVRGSECSWLHVLAG